MGCVDIESTAQDGLHQIVKKLALQGGVMDPDLLAAPLHRYPWLVFSPLSHASEPQGCLIITQSSL